MQNTLLIFFGCGFGGLFRYWIANLAYLLLGRSFPYGTLIVNVSGAFIMGLLTVLAQERLSSMEAPMRPLLLIGLLGGYTTFSSFSMETFVLIESANFLGAALNIILSVSLCLLAVWLGVLLGRQL